MSKDELRISFITTGQNFSEEDINEMIKKYDSDGDGYLQFDEFVNMFSNDICKL